MEYIFVGNQFVSYKWHGDNVSGREWGFVTENSALSLQIDS